MDNFTPLYNTKFTNSKEILARLKRQAGSKTWNGVDVMEWCAECVIQEIKDAPHWFNYKRVQLEVKDGKALLPCIVFRLLDVYNSNAQRVHHFNDGTYLRFQNYTAKYVYINFDGLPIDQDGVVLIPKGAEHACTYYCMKMGYEDDFMTNKVGVAQWQYINEEYDQGLRMALSGIQHLSRNETEEIQKIMYNMVWDPKRVPVFNMDGQ
jgi:hypothetical protein